MSLLVGICHSKDTLRAHHLFDCFQQGVISSGDNVIWIDKYDNAEKLLDKVDVAVTVCYKNRWHKNVIESKFRELVIDGMKQRNKRVIVIDTGFVQNQTQLEIRTGYGRDQKNPLFDIDRVDTYKNVLQNIYYEIGLDGLKRYANYYNENSPNDRWLALNTPIKPWKHLATDSGNILIVCQTYHGLSSQHVNIFDWYRKTALTLRKLTDRQIIFRQHPRNTKVGREGRRRKDKEEILKCLGGSLSRFSFSTKPSIEEDLKEAFACIVFSSNAGVLSVLEGIPTFSCDEGSMAWDVSHHSLKFINDPKTFDREQWAYNLAYSQWNCAEMIEGKPWRHLRPFAIF